MYLVSHRSERLLLQRSECVDVVPQQPTSIEYVSVEWSRACCAAPLPSPPLPQCVTADLDMALSLWCATGSTGCTADVSDELDTEDAMALCSARCSRDEAWKACGRGDRYTAIQLTARQARGARINTGRVGSKQQRIVINRGEPGPVVLFGSARVELGRVV